MNAAFHETVVVFTPVSCGQDTAARTGCGRPDADHSVRQAARVCFPRGLFLRGGKNLTSPLGPPGRGFLTATQQWLGSSIYTRERPLCSLGLHIYELDQARFSPPMAGLQKCSASKLFMFSICRACDPKPPAKTGWLMGASPPLATVAAVTLHKLPEDSTDGQEGHGQPGLTCLNRCLNPRSAYAG